MTLYDLLVRTADKLMIAVYENDKCVLHGDKEDVFHSIDYYKLCQLPVKIVNVRLEHDFDIATLVIYLDTESYM